MTATEKLPALVAAVDVIGRSGATGFEIGYLDDQPPHRWYATAIYKGAKVHGEHPSNPEVAADRLARKLLHGGQCTHCGGKVNVRPWEGHWADAECIWRRAGNRWVRGCE